jgi:NAD(P)-dependent dehydrogenase (short-subunit alcohol dehydrogenase family)
MTKTVLITGGNRGLGKAMVDAFAGADWKVLATARNIDSLASSTSPPTIQFCTLDLSSLDSVNELVANLQSSHQSIDLLIHNAGFNPKDVPNREGYFESTFQIDRFSAHNVAESMYINALNPMELTGKLIQHNILNDTAVILAVSSWLGSHEKKNVPGHYAYSGSKALLNMMITGMAMEFARQNSSSSSSSKQRSAVALNPGWMKTDMGGANAQTTPEGVAQAVLAMMQDGFLARSNGKFLNADRTLHPW